MSKKLNVSGLFSSEPLPADEESEEIVEKKQTTEKKAIDDKSSLKSKKVKNEQIKHSTHPKENDAGEDAKNVNLKLNLNKIKKKKPIEYISFKLKRDVHNHLSKIAKKENIDYTGNLIHLILEDFIKQYDRDE